VEDDCVELHKDWVEHGCWLFLEHFGGFRRCPVCDKSEVMLLGI
jgi:hypothetical protein